MDKEDFDLIDMRIGTISAAALNPKARTPAYVLTIDFGPLGTKTSSAQLTEHYSPDDLVGRQVVAVMNFAPKHIAGVRSEVLVLASVGSDGTVLLAPTMRVTNGSRIA